MTINAMYLQQAIDNINSWLFGVVAVKPTGLFEPGILSTPLAECSQPPSSQRSWLLLAGGQQSAQFKRDFDRLGLGELLTLNEPCGSEDTGSSEDTGDRDRISTWKQQSWSGVIVGNQAPFADEQWPILMNLRLSGTPVYDLADFYETYSQRLPAAMLKDSWLTLSQGFQLSMGALSGKLKRLTDMIAVAILGLCLSPIMLATIVAIRLNSPGPVLYSQVRTGWNGVPFKVYKFRSMYQDAESQGAQWAQDRDPRITKVGHWLRVMRIDELPQLWNVLRGDMSLIGPRPERPEFDLQLAAVIPYYDLRYLVKPGITGWAQVMYPYGASIDDAYEKLAYDLYYLKNYSIGLDLLIALKTIRVVLLGKGR